MTRSLLLTLLFAAVSAGAAAQSDPIILQHRANCRLAVQMLESGQPVPDVSTGLKLLRITGKNCTLGVSLRRVVL